MSGIGGVCSYTSSYETQKKSGQKKSSSNAGRSGGFKDYGDGGE